MPKTNAQVALEAAVKLQASQDSNFGKGADTVMSVANKFYDWLERKG